jgi:adenylate cyclase
MRAKMLLFIGIATATLAGAIALPVRSVYLAGFAQLETELAAQNLDRTQSAVKEDLEGLAVSAHDYANWDETYNFAGGTMPTYGEYNMVLPTYEGLRMSVCTISDNDGKTLYTGAVDYGAKNFRPPPPELGTLSRENELLLPKEALKGRNGIVAASDGVYLVSINPIMPSEPTGSSRGTILMARILDDHEIERLSTQTRLPMQIVRPPSPEPGGIRLLDDEHLRMEWPLVDVHDTPVSTIRIDVPRDIYARGVVGARLIVLTSLIAGFLFGLLLILLLEWLVLRRLAALSADVEQVAVRGDHSMRVRVQGTDEMAELANNVNSMLESLERLTGLLDNARRVLREAFGRYLSEEVAAAVLANPDRLDLSGEGRDLTVLFSDIRGYSVISENLPPREVVSLLNEYFGAMSQEIDKEGGTIIEFLGDAILAVFNAPNDLANHEASAVRAAVAMRRVTLKLNRKWDTEGRAQAWRSRGIERLESRIGIHRGRVVAGNLGSPTRMKYAVIGDTVNTASRVEGLNNSIGTDILLTEPVYANLPAEMQAKCEDKGEHAVKGRVNTVRVWTVRSDVRQIAATTWQPGEEEVADESP